MEENVKAEAGVVLDQVDSLLAVLMRDIDASPGAVDGAEVHACLTAARALLATAKV